MGLKEVISRSRFVIGLVAGMLLTGSVAYSANLFNTPETGYLLCVNQKTKLVTYPATQKCPTGSSKLILGAQGPRGLEGASGEIGPQGIPGIEGPKGEMGIAGPPGPVGQTGPQGPAGNNTTTTVVQTVSQKAYDANNNLIGTVLGVSDQSLTVSNNGSTISYSTNSGGIIQNTEIVYLTADCTGDKFHFAGSGNTTFSDNALGITGIWDNIRGATLAGSYFFGKSEGTNIDRPLTIYFQEANDGVVACRASTVSAGSDSYTINNKLKKFVASGKTFATSFTTPFTYRSG